MRRILFVVVVAVVGWHLSLIEVVLSAADQVASRRTPDGTEVATRVNPLTNLAHVEIALPYSQAIVAEVGPTFVALIEKHTAEELNTRSRENLDLYAMLLPYHVRATAHPADSIGRLRRHFTDLAAEGRHYAQTGVVLTDVRVEAATQFGRSVTAVFGTVSNVGDRTLDRVVIRVSFLDDAGESIGTKDFVPVRVRRFHRNAPLRPSEKRDFGFNLSNDAPLRWSERVRVDVVEVELAGG